MPIAKRRQSNTMLYSILTFVGLFIIATVVAVVFYMKSEEHRTNAQRLQDQINELAGPSEQTNLGKIIGAKERGKSRLSTMVDYVDRTTVMIIGGPLEDNSAEQKVNIAANKAKQIIDQLQDFIGVNDPNNTGLVSVVEKLAGVLNNVTVQALAMATQFEEMKKRFDDVIETNKEKEQILLQEKETYQQQLNKMQADYNELKGLMQQTAEEQANTLMTQRDQARAAEEEMRQQLRKTEAELKMAKDRIDNLQGELGAIKPPPDTKAAAYQADGKVILVDDQAGIVHLNIGSDDRVYRGLRFSVYDKGLPIPPEGRGKAEVEVFNIAKNVSDARIIRSEINRPILAEDIVANLIWDSHRANRFVIAGDFDLDGNGDIDYNAAGRLKSLIEKWGGRVIDKIDVDIDFVILGRQPKLLAKPTFEEMAVDPTAMERYEASVTGLAGYNEVREQAQALSIPIFSNTETFLHLIGFETQAASAGAL